MSNEHEYTLYYTLNRFLDVIGYHLNRSDKDRTKRTVIRCVTLMLCVAMLCTTYTVKAEAFGTYKAELDYFYDGDTIYLKINIFPDLWAHVGLRINGIDTPEIRTRRDCEKRDGFRAKRVMVDALNGIEIYDVIVDKNDKFSGRVDGDILVAGRRLSDLMIESGYAVEYDGTGKAPKWTCI